MRIGFIGLGAMGKGMAGVLLAAGHEVTGFDINPAALDWLEGRGGTRAENAATACDRAGTVVLSVVNAEQARAVLFGESGAVEGLPGGALVVSTVTMPAEAAAETGAEVEAAELYFLDAPVSGGPIAAEAGKLTVMCSGADPAWEAAQPVLDAIGANVFRLGNRPGPGSTMKIVHQLAAGCNLAVAAEVMSFGTHLGLDPAQVLGVLNVSAGGSWMISNRGPRMLTEGTEASSAVNIFVKDLGIVLDAARAARFPVPVLAAALQVFLGASGAGFGKHDDSQATRFYEGLGGKKVRH